MNDIMNSIAYSQTRRQELLEAADAYWNTQLDAVPEAPADTVLPLVVRVGDLLIAAGTKLKGSYAVPVRPLPLQNSQSE